MASEIGCEKSPDWGSAGFGGVFKVEWIRKESIPFQFAQHLVNPWNDNKKVQISRDGQVVLFSSEVVFAWQNCILFISLFSLDVCLSCPHLSVNLKHGSLMHICTFC